MSAEELGVRAASNPFFPRLGTEERLFHATFLFEPVAEEAFSKLTLPAQPGEQAVLAGQALLLYYAHTATAGRS